MKRNQFGGVRIRSRTGERTTVECGYLIHRKNLFWQFLINSKVFSLLCCSVFCTQSCAPFKFLTSCQLQLFHCQLLHQQLLIYFFFVCLFIYANNLSRKQTKKKKNQQSKKQKKPRILKTHLCYSFTACT